MFSWFRSPSLLAVLTGGLIIIYSLFNISEWKGHKVIQGDVCGYYAFLPAIFIYNDLNYDFDTAIAKKYGNAVWVVTTENGKRTPKYTIGLAILNLPAFFIAHSLATITGFPADGYSLPYQMAISLSGGIFTFLGLIFLRLLLRKFFDEWVSALAIISILITTNLYYYSTTESAMSHSYSFFLFAAFLHYILQWLENTSIKNTLLSGIFGGMIVLVRPTNGLIFLLPLLYGISSLADLKAKFQFLLNNAGKILLAGLCVALIVSLQLIYWKMVTGNWILYSYGEERFYFNNPHILKGLFSFRKGWLLYTPLMLLALYGIFNLRKAIPALFVPTLLYTLINIYVIFSWWCWWYGGSFGSRPLVESYALLAIPLADVYKNIFRSGKWTKIIFMLVLLALTWLNLFQTLQKRRSIIHFDSMNGTLYWMVFNDLYHPYDFWNLLEKPDYESAMKGEDEKLTTRIVEIIPYEDIGFNDSLSTYTDTMHYLTPYSLRLNKDNPFSPIITIPYEDFPNTKYNLKVRATSYFYRLNKESELVLIIGFHHGENQAYEQSQRYFKYIKIKDNDWNYLFLDAEVPRYFSPGDVVKVYLFNGKDKDILIDDIGVDFLEVEKY